jgi:hypothetical protein
MQTRPIPVKPGPPATTLIVSYRFARCCVRITGVGLLSSIRPVDGVLNVPLASMKSARIVLIDLVTVPGQTVF